METATITIERAYVKGIRDAQKGRNPNQVFFSDPKLLAAWLKGYEQAKNSKPAGGSVRK